MITGYFGLPGSGKTTFLTMIAQKELRKLRRGRSRYKHILTNFYCKGCERIEYNDFGKYDIQNSLILFDEITLDADSRNFKQFSQEKKEAFILHRHACNDIIYFTQQWDGVDKKIRDLTANLYYVKKVFANIPLMKPFQIFSVANQVYRTLEINEYSKEIITGYRFPNWLEKLLGVTKQRCFRMRWYKFFDSWDMPKIKPAYLYVKW